MGTDKKPCKQFQDTHIDGQFDNEMRLDWCKQTMFSVWKHTCLKFGTVCSSLILLCVEVNLERKYFNHGGICGFKTWGNAPRAGADAESGIIQRSRN